MNIEVRKQGNRKKYYLAHSFRFFDKIKKIRRYLGRDLSKEQLEKLAKRAEELIKQQAESYKFISDPLKKELTSEELELINKLATRIEIKHLSNEDWKLFTELFTYNTNAIEGSELDQKQVKEVLEKNKWPPYASKEDVSETYGLAESVNYIRKTKEGISLDLVKKLHYITFKNSKDFAGKLRKKGIEVVVRDGLGNIIHKGAPSTKVIPLLKELVNWYNKNKKKYPKILLGAVVHNQFENIHPFQDGNGRVGRLLLNNILLKNKLPPININFKNRGRYYKCLQEYETKSDIKPTLNFLIGEYKSLKKQLGDHKNKKM